MTESVRPRARGPAHWQHGLAAAACFIALAGSPVASCAEPVPGRGEIPPAVAGALREAQIPPNAVALVVTPIDGGPLALTLNESTPMNPASTMKLLTTYAALNLLGAAFKRQTRVLATNRPHTSRSDVDFLMRASGDPILVIDTIWLCGHRMCGSWLEWI